MASIEAVRELIEPTLDAMGYDLVRVKLMNGDHATLQVMAERKDGAEMTVEHCAEISRQVSVLLDVEDPIKGAYSLEVSSPGIDRPLVTPGDYVRFAGKVAKLETSAPVEGRRRFRGRLVGVEDDIVRIRCDEQEFEVPFHEIHKAKLVLTDELVAEAMNKQNG